MPRKKKEVNPESEDQLYERFLKKLLKDPRFKQLKPVIMKALGGGRGGRGTGGRSQGMLQTPNQDNFTKIHSSILDTNAKLADLSNQMKRGQFEQYMYWQTAQQGFQGNSQPSQNIPPPNSANAPLSLKEHRTMTRDSFNLSRDNINESPRRLEHHNYEEEEEYHEASQGHIEQLPNIPPPKKRTAEISTQTEARMYDTEDVLSVMSHGSIAARLKAHGFETKGLPPGVDTLRANTAELYENQFHQHLLGAPGAMNMNLLHSGERGRPRLHDPLIEEVETGEND